MHAGGGAGAAARRGCGGRACEWWGGENGRATIKHCVTQIQPPRSASHGPIARHPAVLPPSNAISHTAHATRPSTPPCVPSIHPPIQPASAASDSTLTPYPAPTVRACVRTCTPRAYPRTAWSLPAGTRRDNGSTHNQHDVVRTPEASDTPSPRLPLASHKRPCVGVPSPRRCPVVPSVP